jgi:twitching motility protein PilT
VTTAVLIDRFLRLMKDHGASDLHLSVGRPPAFRVDGRLDPLRYRAITAGDFAGLVRPIAPEAAWARFEAEHDIDFAHAAPDGTRFRVNLFHHERGAGAVLRMIPDSTMTLEQLGLPPSVTRVCELRSGLVLVTGPTGSGKSTTLAAILDHINGTRAQHIVTIEDPIEFVHRSRRSLVTQREVGTHSRAFSTALRAALREDPNIILLGELRDLDTIEMALAAASTGVVVFATLHTSSAAKAVDRIVSVFPAARQDGVRGMVAASLRAVVAQQLLPRRGGGRVAAIEVLFSSSAVSSAIREGKGHQIAGMIQTGRAQGMVAMDESLRALIGARQVEPFHAYERAVDKDSFRKWLAENQIQLPQLGAEG